MKCNHSIFNAEQIDMTTYRCNRCGRLFHVEKPTEEMFSKMCDLLLQVTGEMKQGLKDGEA